MSCTSSTLEDQGDSFGAGQERRRRRQDARPPAAHRAVPEAYIARRELSELRDLLRHCVALTRMRSALAKQGVERPFSKVFGPGGLQFLEALELGAEPRAGSSTARWR
jgi:hypothetical protein